MDKKSFGFMALWASKGVSLGIVGVLMLQFTFFATTTAGMDIGVVGWIILASRIMDAVVGLAAGFWVDKARTRLGKGRPFDLFLLPMWVCVVLLFCVPDVSVMGKGIYIFAFYSLANAVFLSLANGGEVAYLGRAVLSEGERAQVSAGSGVWVMLACTAASIVLPLLMAAWGDTLGGWRLISLVYGIPMCAIGLLRFFAIKEHPDANRESPGGALNFRQSIKHILGNRYILVLASALFLCSLTMTLSSVVTPFYFAHIIDNLVMMSYMGAVGLATPLVLLWFPRAIRTMGGTRFVRAGVALAFVGNLIRLIAPAHIPLLVFGQLLSNTGLLVFTMMQGFFLLQVVSHSAQKTKIRMEGLTAAVSGLCAKIGAGLASVLMGGLMGLAGYSAAAHEQAPSAISMIIALFTWVPAILCALLYVTLCFYDLDRK